MKEIVFRIREQPTFLQTLRGLSTYQEIPPAIRDYLEYNSKPTIQPSFDPLRTLTPTQNLPSQPIASSPQTNIFSRVNSETTVTTNQPQYTAGTSVIGKENPAQKGVSLIKSIQFSQLIFVILAIVNTEC
jgi:hypothetical protein